MYPLFDDRRHAGRELARRLLSYRDRDCIILAVPRGGVAVGYEIAQALDGPLDIVVPRKLPIPLNPEAGFGAIMPDGTQVLNEGLVLQIGLSQDRIRAIAQEVLGEVRRREKVYRGGRPEPELRSRVSIIVDDGLATGYTMIAAVQAVRKRQPQRVVVAVPVAPASAADHVREVADELIVLHISHALPFAVASFYRAFPDMPDSDVIDYLGQAGDRGDRVARRHETGGCA